MRDVPINEPVRIVFEKMLRLTSTEQKLFVAANDKTHLVIKRLQNFIRYHRKFVQDEGSIKPLTFHGLRNTYAAEAYRKLRDAGKSEAEAKRQVSQLLGHRRADVTNLYLASVRQKDGGENSL